MTDDPETQRRLTAGLLAILHGDAVTPYELTYQRAQTTLLAAHVEHVRHAEACRATRVIGPITATTYAGAPGIDAYLSCPHRGALHAHLPGGKPDAVLHELERLGRGELAARPPWRPPVSATAAALDPEIAEHRSQAAQDKALTPQSFALVPVMPRGGPGA